MMAAGHQLSGAAAGLLVAPLVSHPQAIWATPAFVGLVTLNSLLPDMDQPGSKLSRSLGPITWVLSWLLAWFSRLFYYGTRSDLDKPSCGNGHRTMTHTAFWCAFCGLVTYVGLLQTPAHDWAYWAAVGVFTGNLAHIWGDAMTLHGVPFFAPFLKRAGKRWACVWVCPRGLRFRAGGHKKRNRLDEHSRWAWINFGEAVVTFGLTGLVGLCGALTLLASGGPWWEPIGLLL